MGLGVVGSTILTENSSFSLTPRVSCGWEQTLRASQHDQQDGRSQPSCAGGVLLALFTKKLLRRGKFPKQLHVYPGRMAMALLTPPQWGMEDVDTSTEQWQSWPSEQSPAQHWLEGTWTEGTLGSTWWLCCIWGAAEAEPSQGA